MLNKTNKMPTYFIELILSLMKKDDFQKLL
jgi:hypothetical protein